MSGTRSSPLTKPVQLERMAAKIRALQEQGFYGRVTLDIAGGNILRLLKEESIQLGGPDGEPENEAQAHGVENQGATAEAQQANEA